MHGAGSTRTAVLDHAAVLAEHGYGVLLFDARGHGESAGRGMDFGWYGESGRVRRRRLPGRSSPTSPGAHRARRDVHGRRAGHRRGRRGRAGRAVVAEGATNRVAGDKAYLDVYGVRGELQQRVDRVTYGLTGPADRRPGAGLPAATPCGRHARPDPAAFLLITAGEEPDEAHAAHYIRRRAPTDVTTWTVSGAGHTQGLVASPDEWEERVITFLDDALDR